MLLDITFPITDARRFLPDPRLLGAPFWPNAKNEVGDEHGQFERFFGEVFGCPARGVWSWAAESNLCDARRALRLDTDFAHAFAEPHPPKAFTLPVACAFRRFYFNGFTVGKFDFGIAAPHYNSRKPPRDGAPTGDHRQGVTLSPKATWQLLQHFLALKVKVRRHKAAENGLTDCPLAEAGPALAQLYAAASIPVRANPEAFPGWAVRAGTPLLFLEWRAGDQIEPPHGSTKIALPEKWGAVTLSYFHVAYGHERHPKELPLWILDLQQLDYAPKPIRELRRCLINMHMEHQCLLTVLNLIRAGKIAVSPGSEVESYIRSALRRINRRKTRAGEQLLDAESAEVLNTAYMCVEAMDRGLFAELVTLIESLPINQDVRTNLLAYMQGIQLNPLNPESVRLKGSELKQLDEALVHAFPNKLDLERVVRFELDLDPAEITWTGKISDTTFDLVQWADEHNRVRDLVQAAIRVNTSNQELQAFATYLDQKAGALVAV